MKKLLLVTAVLLSWMAFLILCGEKASEVSWESYFIGKAIAFAILYINAKFIDRYFLKCEQSNERAD